MKRLLSTWAILSAILLGAVASGIAADNEIATGQIDDLEINVVKMHDIDDLQLFDGVVEAIIHFASQNRYHCFDPEDATFC
jgi:hypothetical protein